MAECSRFYGLLRTCVVLLTITGVDGSVYFTQTVYRATIPPSLPPGSGIVRVQALEDQPAYRRAGYLVVCELGDGHMGAVLPPTEVFSINSTSHWIYLIKSVDSLHSYPQEFTLLVLCSSPREGATDTAQLASVTITVSTDEHQEEPCTKADLDQECFGGVEGVDRLDVAALSGPVTLAYLKPWVSSLSCPISYSLAAKPNWKSHLPSLHHRSFSINDTSGELRITDSLHHIANMRGMLGYLNLTIQCSIAEGFSTTRWLQLYIRDLNDHRPHSLKQGSKGSISSRMINKTFTRSSHIKKEDKLNHLIFMDNDFHSTNNYRVCLHNDTLHLLNITNVTFVTAFPQGRKLKTSYSIDIAFSRDVVVRQAQYVVDVVVTDTSMIHVEGSQETLGEEDNQFIYRLIFNLIDETEEPVSTHQNLLDPERGANTTWEDYRPCWCGGDITCPIRDYGFLNTVPKDGQRDTSIQISRSNQTYLHHKSTLDVNSRITPPQNIAVQSTQGDSCGQSCRIMVALTMAVITVLCIVAFMAWRVRRRHRKSEDIKHVGSLASLSAIPSDYVDERSRRVSASSLDWSPRFIGSKLPVDTKWEFNRKNLVLDKCLGEGEFGRVVRAKAFNIRGHEGYTTVAVKMLKPCASGAEFKDLLSEYTLLKDVCHTNVIKLLGACSQKGPFYLIVEYCKHGSLRSYLRFCRQVAPTYVDSRDTGLADSLTDTDTDAQITSNDLLSFCWQIAKGMEYLSLMKVVHRDLAARNVLVASNKVIKISDFGLSRDIYEEDTYLKTSKGRVPVKWMAPESLYDHIYTTKSDVWSFGVILWEIVTLGATPYPGLVPEHLYHLLKSGYRMDRPTNCSENLYSVMSQCWGSLPNNRPTFKQLSETFETMLQSSVEYLDLSAALQERSALTDDDSGDPRDDRHDKLEVDGYNSDLEEGYGSISRLSTDDQSYLTYTPASHADDDDDDHQVTYSQVITCDDCTLRMLQANQGADHVTENTLLLACASGVKITDSPIVEGHDDVSDEEGLRLADESEALRPEHVIIV